MMDCLLASRYGGPGLIDLIYGNELFCEERLDAMKVVGLVKQLCVRTVEGCLSGDHVGLGLVDSGCGTIDVCGGAVGVGTGGSNGAYL